MVDDEAAQLRTARRILEQLGYDVVIAPSGEAALELYSRTDPDAPFDLVVLDVVMPGGIGGITAIERMRAIRPGQRAVLVSGWGPEQLAAIPHQQAVVWLQKPYSIGDLAVAVRDALDRPANPSAAPRSAAS